MADFIPFKGLLYNSGRIENLSAVVAPPYDVISKEEQEALYTRDPHNIVRLILGKKQTGDNHRDNEHLRAAAFFSQWMESKVLLRDEQNCFYLTSVDFEYLGRPVTRYGIIGLVRLEPFERGIVLPHERTFSKVKSERLHLMQSCHANFSPIFGLYADHTNALVHLRTVAETQPAEMDLYDIQGLRHKLWRIKDTENISNITNALKDSRIYIADGHHRYETALTYRDWVKQNKPQYDLNHPSNYVMMSLSSLEDPGLIIFPAHRLLKQVPEQELQMLLSKARDYFDFRDFPIEQKTGQGIKDLDAFLHSFKDENVLGVYVKGDRRAHAMKLKKGVMQNRYAQDLPDALLDLDVTVLTRLVMMDLLNFDQERLDDEKKISYRTTALSAIESVRQGRADLAFILNPTKIEQVKRVAEDGLIMPRKSTYFYPKVISGQVMNLLW